jgi:hypothetical protein
MGENAWQGSRVKFRVGLVDGGKGESVLILCNEHFVFSVVTLFFVRLLTRIALFLHLETIRYHCHR